jgi:tRNA pseudouridine32 synthase / 23S rRNA pseudouridine746 synthase
MKAVYRPSRDGVQASIVALPPGPWLTLHDFFCERFAHVSPQQWHWRFARGDVMDQQGQQLAATQSFQANQKLFYFRDITKEPELPVSESIVFQDEHLVVADKPHFLPVTPGGQYLQNTLLVRLKRRLQLPDLTPIHRLDRETAGLVIFSCRPSERAAYQGLFQNRQVSKRYEAVALLNNALQFPLQRETRLTPSAQFMQMQEVQGAPNAITRIALAQLLPDGMGLFHLWPHTGAKHQLRVHMAALGMPILGDRIYPALHPFRKTQDEDFSSPLKLLARHLCFTDPVTEEKREFFSQLRL